MADPLHERITAALDGTTPGPWEWGRWGAMEAPSRMVGDVHVSTADGELIAAAPSLLAECARRLDPGDTDVARVIDQVRFVAQWDASGLLASAADLLAQAFLDPQETT